MTVEADLFTRLSTFTGLSALVADKVYPLILPQGVTLPAVSYQRVSSIRPSAMGADIGIVRARFQVDVWAQDFDSSKAIAEQIRLALQCYHGTGTVEILEIFFLNEVDLYEENTRIAHQALDFEVNYRE
jgi:hypothetical protein